MYNNDYKVMAKMSTEKLNTLLLLGKLNAIKRTRKLTDIEILEYKTLLNTMPKE